MSNTYTNITPDVVVNEILGSLKAGAVGLQAFSTQYPAVNDKGQDLGKDDVIRVPIIAGRTAATWSQYETTTGNTIAGTAVTLDQRHHTPIYDADGDRATPPDQWMAKARESAYATGLAVFQNAIGKFIGATYGDVDGTSKIVKAAASFGIDDVADMKTLLGERNAIEQQGEIALIVNLAYAAALIKDAGIQNADKRGGTDIIVGGWFSLPLMGVKVYQTNAFPSALTAENTGAIMCVPSALGVAMGPVRPTHPELAASAGVVYREVRDDETGIIAGYREWYNSDTGRSWGDTETLHGAAALQTSAAIRCESE